MACYNFANKSNNMELGLEFLNADTQKKLYDEYSTKQKSVDDTKEDVISTEEKDKLTNIEDKVEPSSKVRSSSPYVPFAKHLMEEGLLSEETFKEIETEGSLDSLVDGLRKQLDVYSTHKINKYQPEFRDLIELSESGVDKEQAKSIVKDAMELSKITNELVESDEKLQEQLVRKYLSKMNLSQEEQDEQIEYLKDTDKLLSKALDHKNKLVEINMREKELAKKQAEISKQQQQEAVQKQLQVLKTQIDDLKELIPGIKVSNASKEAIYKNLTTPVALDEENQPITYVQQIRAKDPIKFEIMLNYLAEQGVFEGKFDSIIRGTKSKTVEELEKTLKDTNLFDKGVATVVKEASKERDESKTKDLVSSIPNSFDELLSFIKK